VVRPHRLMARAPDGPLWLAFGAYVLLTVGVMPVSTSIDHAPSNFYFWFAIGVLVRMVELEQWRQWYLTSGNEPEAPLAGGATAAAARRT